MNPETISIRVSTKRAPQKTLKDDLANSELIEVEVLHWSESGGLALHETSNQVDWGGFYTVSFVGNGYAVARFPTEERALAFMKCAELICDWSRSTKEIVNDRKAAKAVMKLKDIILSFNEEDN